MFVVGGLDDQLPMLTWFNLVHSNLLSYLLEFEPYRQIFTAYINPFSTNEPLSYLFILLLSLIFGSSSHFAFLIIVFFLNIFFTYNLFKESHFRFVYTLIFCFSSYYWTHFSIHPSLAHVWVISFYFSSLIGFLLKKGSWQKLAVAQIIAVLFSSYYGFFLFFFTISILINSIVVSIKTKQYRNVLVGPFLIILTSVLLSFIIEFRYIKANYFDKVLTSSNSSLVLKRPIEDFFYFSVRPWYFVIPPQDSQVYGNLPENILRFLANTNHYLFDDYFAGEHSGLFFGILFNVSLLLFLILFILKNGFGKLFDTSIKRTLGIGYLSLILISLPPYITLFSFKLYTPGYIVSLLFPMFRVTSRVAVILLLCNLLLFSFLVEKIMINRLTSRLLTNVLVSFFCFTTLFETFVPVSIEKFEKEPEVYRYMSEKLPKGSTFVAYPYSRVEEPFLYIPVHNQYFINIKGYVFNDITSEDLTKSIPTQYGAANLQKKEVKYLLLFKNNSNENQSILRSKDYTQFEEFSDSFLLKLKEE